MKKIIYMLMLTGVLSVGFFYEQVTNLPQWDFRKNKILCLNALADEAFPAPWTVSFYPRRSSSIELEDMR